jgi:predicted nucleic acid-binding Zn finger protein
MDSLKPNELKLIDKICNEIKTNHSLKIEIRKKLEESFGERLQHALNIIEKGAVKRYKFKPSGRIIWEVKGKTSSYQIMTRTYFCNCDDYYFRVMSSKKQLCYHIIAQKLAFALGKFKNEERSDRDYSKITSRWRKSVR